MADAAPDWREVVERLGKGDGLAFFQLSRLVTGVLGALRAYDFRDEWSDLVQEVALATIVALRDGRLARTTSVAAYLRQITHHKFADRLRQQQRHHDKGAVPLDALSPDALRDHAAVDTAAVLDLRRCLERLPVDQRALILAVFGEQKSCEEAASELAIPLGSARRYLSRGLIRVRRCLSDGGR